MSRLDAMLDPLSRWRVPAGAAVLLVGLLLLGFTEHTDRVRVAAEDALGGPVLTEAAARPGSGANGQLVLAVGAPKVTAVASDAQFGVSAPVPALVRKVEMFQWQQTNFGGQLGYELDWFDRAVDSTHFVKATSHANPGALPLASQRFDSPGVTVAGFKLAPALVRQIHGMEPFQPDFHTLAANMAVTFRVEGAYLVTSAGSGRPQVGDLRVSWQQVAPAYLTVLARDHAGTLAPAISPSGTPVAHVMVGRLSLTDVLTRAPQPAHFKWARRVLALLLAWAGVWLLLPPTRAHDRILAVAIAVPPLALLASGCWLGVRTLAAIALLLVAVAAAATAVWRWRATQSPD